MNKQGENQIYCVPGINDDFSPTDVDRAASLFEGSADKGILALTLEMPLDTAVHAIRKARTYRLRVVLDPGGISASQDVQGLLQEGIYCIKPNEHEAKILTGINIVDFRPRREPPVGSWLTGSGTCWLRMVPRARTFSPMRRLNIFRFPLAAWAVERTRQAAAIRPPLSSARKC